MIYLLKEFIHYRNGTIANYSKYYGTSLEAVEAMESQIQKYVEGREAKVTDGSSTIWYVVVKDNENNEYIFEIEKEKGK